MIHCLGDQRNRAERNRSDWQLGHQSSFISETFFRTLLHFSQRLVASTGQSQTYFGHFSVRLSLLSPISSAAALPISTRHFESPTNRPSVRRISSAARNPLSTAPFI